MTSTRLVSRQKFPYHFSDAALAGLVGQHTNISADPDASFMSLLVPTGRAVVAAVQLISRTRDTTEVLITFDYEDDQPDAPTEVEVRIVEAEMERQGVDVEGAKQRLIEAAPASQILDWWAAMIPDPHPRANCGPLLMTLAPGEACPTCGTVPA
jgi:hypothetical protein